MISRVAEHCLWLSRYLERAENTARGLDVNQTLLLDFEVPLEQQWRPLLIISGIHDFAAASDGEAVQDYMTWQRKNGCSIASSLAAARENARIIREVISADMWERINYYHLWLHGPAARALYDKHRSEFYCQIKRINQLIHGISDATMSQGEAWEFCRLGMYLERACQTARVLDVKYHILLPKPEHVGTPVDNAHWMAILTSCSGYEPYHKKQPPSTDPGVAVANFLIFDPQFPRSVSRCLEECQRAIHAISRRPIGRPCNDVEHRVAGLLAWLHKRDIRAMMRDGLHESLTTVVNRIHDLGESIHRTYFDVHLQALPAASVPGGPQVPLSRAEPVGSGSSRHGG
jgi:uncharacterized alpha-E superfamily protein